MQPIAKECGQLASQIGWTRWPIKRSGVFIQRAVIALAAVLFASCSDPVTPPGAGAQSRSSASDRKSATPSPAGAWRVSRDHDPMDNSSTIHLFLDATEHARLFPPTRQLVIRCRRNKTAVVIVTHEPVQTNMDSLSDLSRTRVRYKIDGAPAVSEYWSESTGLTAIFSRSPIAFARKLASARELLLEYSPYGSVERTLRFDVSGLAHVLPEVASQCNWKFERPATLAK